MKFQVPHRNQLKQTRVKEAPRGEGADNTNKGLSVFFYPGTILGGGK